MSFCVHKTYLVQSPLKNCPNVHNLFLYRAEINFVLQKKCGIKYKFADIFKYYNMPNMSLKRKYLMNSVTNCELIRCSGAPVLVYSDTVM